MLPDQTGLHGWAAVVPVLSKHELTVILPQRSQLPPPAIDHIMPPLEYEGHLHLICEWLLSRSIASAALTQSNLLLLNQVSSRMILLPAETMVTADRTLSKQPCCISIACCCML